MAGRFSSSAGAVIADALARARDDGTGEIQEEHLFAALLDNPGSRALLGGLGGLGRPQEAETVWAEVREVRRRGGITATEQRALAEFGIDLDEVVAHVEAQLGAGALDTTPESGRRRRASMSPDVVTVLNAAQRQRSARGDRGLSAQHILLGLLAQPGPFADALGARGITVASALAALDDHGPDTGTGR